MSLVSNFFWPVPSPWFVQIQVWYLVLHKYLALGLYETLTQGMCVWEHLEFWRERDFILSYSWLFLSFLKLFPFISAASSLRCHPISLSLLKARERDSILSLIHCSSLPPHTHCAYPLSFRNALTSASTHTHIHTHSEQRLWDLSVFLLLPLLVSEETDFLLLSIVESLLSPTR